MNLLRPTSALFLFLLFLCQCSKPETKQPSQPNENQLTVLEKDYGLEAYQHTEAILQFGPRCTQTQGLKNVRNYLKQELAKHNWVAVEQTFTADTPIGPRTFTNVIARYQPTGSPAHSIWKRSPKGVLGAHIDSKYLPGETFLGADDAASAVGAILEISAYLHKHSPANAKKLELVFFDGEEAFGDTFDLHTALFGSRHYAALVQRAYQKKPTIGIILDMIGHQDLSIILPSNSAPELIEQTLELATELGISQQYKRGGPILDDHVPLNTIAGIPTIDILGDFANKHWWHTPQDNLDIISKESLEQNIKLTLHLLARQL